jgi:hypothetical protein
MFTSEQYRAKAAQFGALLKTAGSPAEEAEYRDLKQSYESLAENLDWLAENSAKTVGSGKPLRRERVDRHEAYAEQENVLRCLGAAVILTWNTIPRNLQRALFEAASKIEDSERKAPLKDVLAQFLHDHKDDVQQQRQQQNGS